jgi:hypothetical protein
MKKKSEEIVSLNEELISFDSADIGIETLEQRLEMTITHIFSCEGFTCRDFVGCQAFTCNNFH